MGVQRHRVPAVLNLLVVLAVLAAAAASTALVVIDESRDLRVGLCATIAGAFALISLVSAPAVRPYLALAGRRRRGAAWFGRLLVRVCWLLRVGTHGATAGFIAWNAGSAALQPVAAGLVVASGLLTVGVQLGQHAAGFVTALDDLRGWGALRRTAAIVVAAVAAGSAGYVAAVPELLRVLLVDPVWELVHEQWGLPGFLAGVAATVTNLLVVTVIAAVVGGVMFVASRALGPGTAVGRWLATHSPVQYHRGVDTVRIKVVLFNYSNFAPFSESAARASYPEVRHSTGPLHSVFHDMLTRDVVEAGTALAPSGARHVVIVLRAVGDHEEVLLEYVPAGGDEGPDAPRETLPLHDFPEVVALRRIRLALQSPLSGLPSEVRCTGTQIGRGPWVDVGAHRMWAPRPPDESAEEPEWVVEPSHDDLVREVVRYPPGPGWLRDRLGLLPFEPDW